jgi:ferric-dicitrate binding protein FerR (iron transport regulator)
LGTSFNVSAYSEERYVEVVLQNGKVEFSDNVRAGQVVMKPSERLVFRDKKVFVDADSLAGATCSGGSCDVVF